MKTYEEEKKRLTDRIEALATDYFFSVIGNDGKEIKETFQEYFNLIKGESTIDKAIVGYACDILLTFNKNVEDLDDDIENDASEMALYLMERMSTWRQSYVWKILQDKEFPRYWEDVDEMQELIQRYKNK